MAARHDLLFGLKQKIWNIEIIPRPWDGWSSNESEKARDGRAIVWLKLKAAIFPQLFLDAHLFHGKLVCCWQQSVSKQVITNTFEGQPVSEEEMEISLPCINMKFKIISNLKLPAKYLSYCGHLSNCFLFLRECNVKTEK